MTQFTTTTARRTGGDLDVYTGLLCAALLVLVAGVALLAIRNSEHSKDGSRDGGAFTIVNK